MSFITQASVQNRIADAEQLLNLVDYVPFIASFSGMIRILAAEVEIATGAAFICIKVFQSILDGSTNTFWEAKKGLMYIKHGLLNVLRGAIAMIPVVQWILLLHDYKLGRYNYEEEKVRRYVYPLATPERLAQKPNATV